MLKLIKENIPEKLRELDQWVGFILNDEGKKIPINPKVEGNGDCASISDPSTWGSFEQAAKTVEVGMCVGIEFAMTPESNLIFLDIDCHTDKCKTEEEKEELRNKYKAMCRAASTFRTYQEKSFSINGGTSIVRTVFGNKLKYSLNFNGYYIWDGKRYVDYGDSDILIHPITETLALVEHSVFRYVMTEVINADDTVIVLPADNKKEKDKTMKDLMEEQSIKLFQDSKRYVDYKLAKEVLKKYKGMNVFDDIKDY